MALMRFLGSMHSIFSSRSIAPCGSDSCTKCARSLFALCRCFTWLMLHSAGRHSAAQMSAHQPKKVVSSSTSLMLDRT